MRTEQSWLILDPLLSPESLNANCRSVRLSRLAGPNGWQLDGNLPGDVGPFVNGKNVGVVDDVAMTGMTGRCIASLVSEAGGVVSRFAFCASSKSAQASLCSQPAPAAYEVFVQGDFDTIHMRDACPGLPFSGRRVSGLESVDTPTGPVAIAAPVTATRGGPWGRLALDSGLNRSISFARRLLADRLSAALGRAAIVSDLRLLGNDVYLPLRARLQVDSQTALATILT
jgi:hypothetical protein